MLLVWGAGYVSRRHAIVALVPLIGFAALAWRGLGDALLERWESSGDRRPLSHRAHFRCVCAALIAVLVLVWGPRDLRERRVDRTPLREAAHWIAEHQVAPRSVAAEKLRMAYYADAGYVPLKADGGESLEEALRRGGARWIVIDGDRLDRYPGLVEGVGDWIQPVHHEESGNRRAVVFEILQKPAP